MTAERLRRWRLTLGGDSADTAEDVRLSADDQRMDEALAALYGAGRPGDGSSTEPRTGGLGGSAPRVATWLGDIRAYFPSSVVHVMQRDAIDRLGVRALLLEPELMESLEPDVHLVSTLISLGSAIPETSRATARSVVRTVVDDVEKRIANRTRAAVTGASTGPPGRTGRSCATSTGTAPSQGTSSTICPSSAPSCRSGWSGTGGVSSTCSATSSLRSTSPGRWPRRSCTRRSSAR